MACPSISASPSAPRTRCARSSLAVKDFLAGSMSDAALRARRHHRHRPHRLVAGARAAARQAGARRSSPARARRQTLDIARDAGLRRRVHRSIRPRRRRTPISSSSRTPLSAYAEIGRRIGPALDAGRHRHRCRLGEGRGGARSRAASCRRACISSPAIPSPAPSIRGPPRASPSCSTAAGAS